jgi:CelD/BcsL family acetyltransferase involved in cellulose biosynthesis
MVVERITTMRSFLALRERWDEIYDADGRANVFLSWAWIDACMQTSGRPWTVLAARLSPADPYLAFLPLACERFPLAGPALAQDLCLAGIPRADYTGLIAAPWAPEDAVLAAFAAELEAMRWDNFRLNDALDERVGKLARYFAPERFEARLGGQTLCPFITLPDRWETYLESVSEKTRAKLVKKTRQLAALPGYRFERADERGIDDAIETLLRLNRRRWRKNLGKGRRTFAGLFRHCFESGVYAVFSIFDGTVPVASQGFFIDHKRRAFCAYMVGFNGDYASFSPGTVLHGLTIRYAIEHGFAEYDLLRGNEPFKSRFASRVRTTNHLTLTRRGMRSNVVNAGRSGVYAAKALARRIIGRTA